MSENKRASFGGKLSVVLVAAGSAIGLGAIWRFPYIAGKHGGAAFLLVFLISVFAVGIPTMLAEFAVGRRTRKNAVGAFRSLSKRWSWLGYNGVLGALLISGYYYIIAGWSLEYMVASATNMLYSSPLSFTEQFNEFQGMLSEDSAFNKVTLDKLMVETYTNIIMGESVDTFDAFVDEWYAEGGQEILDEANAWYESKK